MAHARMRQLHEDLPRSWGWDLESLDRGADFSGGVVGAAGVVRRDRDVCHFFFLWEKKTYIFDILF